MSHSNTGNFGIWPESTMSAAAAKSSSRFCESNSHRYKDQQVALEGFDKVLWQTSSLVVLTMEQWTYDAERYGPPNQPHITVDELLSHPDIIPVLNKRRWSRQEKSKIAAVLKNRPSVDMSEMTW